MLKPPDPFQYETLASLEEGLGAELAASTAEACARWLDGSAPASEPNQAPPPALGAPPVWLVYVADAVVRCHLLSKWQVTLLLLSNSLSWDQVGKPKDTDGQICIFTLERQ